MGSRTFVFLCNYKLASTAMARPELQDRPDLYSLDVLNEFKKYGLFNANGLHWYNGRRFAVRHLREMGMGKSSMETTIQYEAARLVEDFNKYSGHSQTLPWSINVAFLNVIWKLTADRRYEVDDPEVQSLHQLITSLFIDFQGNVVWFDLFPWVIPYTPQWLVDWLNIGEMSVKARKIKNFMLEEIKRHRASLNPDDIRDYIDAYLVEMEKENHQESTFCEDDLWIAVANLFIGGTETVSATMRWYIMYMAQYPEVQARVQQEIDSVVPRDTAPALEHRDKLPYTEAVAAEVNRLISVSPTALPHLATRDTELFNYTIPKGTILIAHQECCHRDPNYWEKPDQFYPGHFLDKDGNFISKKESYIPFNIGRRQCLGESLARMELFLFQATLMQNFTFSVPKGEKLPFEKDPTIRIVNIPKLCNVVITKRK